MNTPHTHTSPTLQATAVQWPHPSTDPNRITLQPGDWQVHLIVRAPVADSDQQDALRRLLEYALATLDHHTKGPDAHLDDEER